MEPGEAVHVGGDLSVELLEEAMGHRAERFRFLVVEAGRLDVPLEDPRRRRGVVRRAPVLREEDPGDLVDPLVLRLRGKNRRDEELQRRGEAERGPPVGIRLREAAQDLPSPRP